MDEIALNFEYIKTINQMRKLNEYRFNIYKKMKKVNPNIKIPTMVTVSIYPDLYGNDMDEIIKT